MWLYALLSEDGFESSGDREKIGYLINFLLLRNEKQPPMFIAAPRDLFTSPNDYQRILTLGSNYLHVNVNTVDYFTTDSLGENHPANKYLLCG